ncbi:hypothetical protein [Mesorhizobium sp. 113-3-3]|uniref:hypothetical protein n=1 Tax=Mesorhizobium sp. 113-3-3 TaxID=2744516 RepID=UPI001FD091EE|nr:hypothetical protein [Mesorhizobium sp. 113-3-3]
MPSGAPCPENRLSVPGAKSRATALSGRKAADIAPMQQCTIETQPAEPECQVIASISSRPWVGGNCAPPRLSAAKICDMRSGFSTSNVAWVSSPLSSSAAALASRTGPISAIFFSRSRWSTVVPQEPCLMGLFIVFSSLF